MQAERGRIATGIQAENIESDKEIVESIRRWKVHRMVFQ